MCCRQWEKQCNSGLRQIEAFCMPMARISPSSPWKGWMQKADSSPTHARKYSSSSVMLQSGGNVQGAENAYAQGSRLGDPLAGQDNARLQQALAAQAAAAKGSANYNSLDRIINQQAKQILENRLHNEGTLNINEHLP